MKLAQLVNNKISKLDLLFKTDVSPKVLWETYLNSFKKEDNPIVNENKLYDCNHCRSFIQRYGDLVYIKNNEIKSIWNLKNVPKEYQRSVEAMRELVESAKITEPFYTNLDVLGVESNIANPGKNDPYNKTGTVYYHLFSQTPAACKINNSVDTKLAHIKSTAHVVMRSFQELSIDVVVDILETAKSNMLAKGEENILRLETYIDAYNEWKDSGESNTVFWQLIMEHGRLIAIRNTAIGTLLTDLSNDVERDEAYFKYNQKVDPVNFKRKKAIITTKQKEEFSKSLQELGYLESLSFTHTSLNEISGKNVLWVSKEANSKLADPLAFMNNLVSDSKVTNVKNITEIGIEEFMNKILSKTSKLEVLVENNHRNNFMNVLRQQNLDSKNILKWNNPFTVSYNGDTAGASDIMKAIVEKGGDIEGYQNFRIAWNDSKTDRSDLDAWCKESSGHSIGFSTYRGAHNKSKFGGFLDVDIQNPGTSLAVENINYKLPVDGKYTFYVNQFSARNSQGFRAEYLINGTTYCYEYNAPIATQNKIEVVSVLIKNGVPTITHHLTPTSEVSQDIWGVTTNEFHEVSTFMLSPNYWDNQIGTPQYLFILDKVQNSNTVRALYNEYITDELRNHGRAIEVLGGAMRVPVSKEQLAGIGFYKNKQHNLTVKADGRPYKINFNDKQSSSKRASTKAAFSV